MRDHEFEWDDRKAKRNFRDHHVAFEQARVAFNDPDGIDEDDPDPHEERFSRLCKLGQQVLVVVYTEIAFASYQPDWQPSMSNASTSGNERDKYGMTAEDWRRPDAMTDEEIVAAALKDPDNPPLTDEQLARFRRPALVKRIRHQLHIGRETFAAAYGIPLETLRAWERHEVKPTEVEIAYLRLIEREPEMAKMAVAVPTG